MEADADADQSFNGATGATGAEGATGLAEPDSSAAEEPAATGGEQVAAEDTATTASLMELEAKTLSKVSYCKDMDSCKKPYTEAFKLYKLGYAHAKQNKVFFEKERAALGGFRDGLKEIIKNKEDKKAALEKQQAEIAAKLANPPPGLDELFPLIDKHEEIVHKGCSEMKGRSDKALKELKDIEDVFNSKGCTQCDDDSSASTGAQGLADESSAESIA